MITRMVLGKMNGNDMEDRIFAIYMLFFCLVAFFSI